MEEHQDKFDGTLDPGGDHLGPDTHLPDFDREKVDKITVSGEVTELDFPDNTTLKLAFYRLEEKLYETSCAIVSKKANYSFVINTDNFQLHEFIIFGVKATVNSGDGDKELKIKNGESLFPTLFDSTVSHNIVMKPQEAAPTMFNISGTVTEYSTTKVLEGLEVAISRFKSGVEETISSCITDKNGRYSFVLNTNEIFVDADNKRLKFIVKHKNRKLELFGEEIIDTNLQELLYVNNIATKICHFFKGKLKRYNDVNATGCLVELYSLDNSEENIGNKSIIVGKALTDVNGDYSIPYRRDLLAANAKLQLKFYNNEDIETTNDSAESVPSSFCFESFSTSEVSYINDIFNGVIHDVDTRLVNEECFVGDIIVNERDGKKYEVLSVEKTGEGWNITETLVSGITYEPKKSVAFWTYYAPRVGQQDYYGFITKMEKYSPTLRSIKILTPNFDIDSEDATSWRSLEYNVKSDNFKTSLSPKFATANKEDIVNFKFTTSTLNLYSVIFRRENFFVPSLNISDANSALPKRFFRKGYNVDEIPGISSILGVSVDEVKAVSHARDLNGVLKMEVEEALFGLFMAGVEPTITSIFSMSNDALNQKLIEAKDKNYISSDLDVNDVLTKIKNKIVSIIELKFNDIFVGIDDNVIKTQFLSNSNHKSAFVRKLVGYTYDNLKLDDSFWQGEKSNPLFVGDTSGIITRQVKRAVEYSNLCMSSDGLINSFVNNSGEDNAELKPVNDILALNSSGINDKINTAYSIAIPVFFMPHSSKDERVEAFGRYVNNKIETIYPTKSLFLRLVNMNDFSIKGDSDRQDLFNALRTKLISATEDSGSCFYDISKTIGKPFNIEKDSPRDYIEKNLSSFSAIMTVEGTGANSKDNWILFLSTLQRNYSITNTSRFETVVTLVERGINSAYDVVMMGRERFVDKVAGGFAEGEDLKVYHAAELKVNKVLSILNKYSTATNSANPAFVRPGDPRLNGTHDDTVKLLTLPDMQTLFGDQDITDTDHGDSVLSPAAYLVDILNLLNTYKINGDKIDADKDAETLYTRLIKRRPEIAKIPLDSANAVTHIPYIDLVIEILENEVCELEASCEVISDFKGTTKSAEEIKANPEYINYNVYDVIKNREISSWSHRPFDMFSDEMKIYSRALGLNRSKLAVPFSKIDSVIDPYFDVLNLTAKDKDLFPFNDSKAAILLNEILNLLEFDAPVYKVRIKNLLSKTDMRLDDLNVLLSSYYVNPLLSNGGVRYSIHYSGKIKLNNAYLQFVTKDAGVKFIKRMYQYYRLLDATSWSVNMLDSILFSGSDKSPVIEEEEQANTLIDNTDISTIGKIKILQQRYDLSKDNLIKLSGDINLMSYDDNLFYDQLKYNDLSEHHKNIMKQVVDNIYNDKDIYVFNVDNSLSNSSKSVCEFVGITEDVFGKLAFLFKNFNGRAVFDKGGFDRLLIAKSLIEMMDNDVDIFVEVCQNARINKSRIILSSNSDINVIVEEWRRRLLNESGIPRQLIRWRDISGIKDCVETMYRNLESDFEDKLNDIYNESGRDAIAIHEDGSLTNSSKKISEFFNMSEDNFKKLSILFDEKSGDFIYTQQVFTRLTLAYHIITYMLEGDVNHFVVICRDVRTKYPSDSVMLAQNGDLEKIVETWINKETIKFEFFKSQSLDQDLERLLNEVNSAVSLAKTKIDNRDLKSLTDTFFNVSYNENDKYFWYNEDNKLSDFSAAICKALALADSDIDTLKFLFKVENEKLVLDKFGLNRLLTASALMDLMNVSAVEFKRICELNGITSSDNRIVLTDKINDSEKLISIWNNLVSHEIDLNQLDLLLKNYNGENDAKYTLDDARNVLNLFIAEKKRLTDIDPMVDNDVTLEAFFINSIAKATDSAEGLVKEKLVMHPFVMVGSALKQITDFLLNNNVEVNDPNYQHIIISLRNCFVDITNGIGAETLVNNILKQKDTLNVYPDTLENKDELTEYIVNQISDLSKVDSEMTEAVMKKYTVGKLSVTDYIINLLKPEEFYAHTVVEHIKEPVVKILKVLSAANMFKLTVEDLKYADAAPIDIFNLPQKSDDADITFDAFINMLALCDAGKYVKADKNRFDLYAQITTKSVSELNSVLDQYIYFKDMLTVWIHNDMYTDGTKTKYNTNLTWFNQIGEVFKVVTRDGDIGADDAFNLIKREGVSSKSINKIAEKTKEWISKKRYFEIVTDERNNLRTKQRNALVQYMLEKKPDLFKDENDLFSYYLIDTQMTPAVSSSRIVQATLAIQLFVQRIQMNLEPGVSMRPENKKNWEWMSLYRVWEANRKIFLYPENWIEPELRDDKTPFFEDLEKELTSNEINKDTINRHYAGYISKLQDVANIEICQMYNEEGERGYSVLHVIGRTRNEPKEFYYRKLINESYWTPWVKLDVQINSEHIAPVVINDRLILFWLEFMNDAVEPTDEDLKEDNKGKKPDKYYKIQVCWSEYVNGKWSQKKVEMNTVKVKYTSESEKMDYRLVYTDEADKYLSIVKPTVITESSGKTTGFSYKVECYNQVVLTKMIDTESTSTVENGTYKGGTYVITNGLKNKAQSVMMANDDVKWVTLPVLSVDSGLHPTNIVENISSVTKVIYPHQYGNFYCQAPFVVENGLQSLIYIPSVKADIDKSEVQKKVTDITNDESKKKSIAKVKVISNLCEASVDGSQSGSVNENENIYTDVDSNATVNKITPCGKPIVTIPVVDDEELLKANNSVNGTVDYKYKPVMNAHLGYLPYMENMRRAFDVYGVDGVLDPDEVAVKKSVGDNAEVVVSKVPEYIKVLKQQRNVQYLTNFEMKNDIVQNLVNSDDVDLNNKYITEKFEYTLDGSYSIYNWEMFFHIPYLISNRYFIEGNYDEALKWIHFIYDPRESEGEAPERFWKFKPFADYNAKVSIDELLYDISDDTSKDDGEEDINKQIENWSNDPFKPHNIARIRLSAYMKAVIMRYLDILIARGDESFRLDTMESINEAMQYYILGAQQLGRKPEVIKTSILDPKAYNEFNSKGLGNAIETFEEALIKPENSIALERFVESQELNIASKPASADSKLKGMATSIFAAMQKTNSVSKLYFGIPKNNKMLGYWDLVADRLFKIRNSLNIDGVARTLSLFAPPIDPGMLVRAAAAGLNILDVVKGKGGNQTEYRFQTLLQRAMEISNEVKSLGGGLLSAIEKRDNEKLSKLRASHEINLAEKLTQIKDKSIEEAQYSVEHLNLLKKSAEFREKYYRDKKYISDKEQEQINYMNSASDLQLTAQGIKLFSSFVSSIPDMKTGTAGVWGSPFFNIKIGGEKIGLPVNAISDAMSLLSSIDSHRASLSGTYAGYERRKEDWTFQADTIAKELEQIDKQILSAQIRKEISELDKKNHLTQIEQSKESYEILKSKFSNEQLYIWMAKEISALHRVAFDLACNMAKQAEDAYNYEIAPHKPVSFITNNHFNADNKGLLAGEKLYMDLKKMEAEYLESHKRKNELTKYISLALIDSHKIIDLRSKGTCSFKLPELLFDMDYPGHYNRRIKGVSITIPCVTGAYTTVAATLTMTGDSGYKMKSGEKHHIKSSVRSSIATSNGSNDSGMFEFNFNDARYLPFEGAGIESEWTLSLPENIRQFNYESISDIIVHINYTSEGTYSKIEENKVIEILNSIAKDNTVTSIFSVRSQFPEVWDSLNNGNNTEVVIEKSMLPYYYQNSGLNTLKFSAVRLTGNKSVDIDIAQAGLSTETFVSEIEYSDFSKSANLIIKSENMSDADDIIIKLDYNVNGDMELVEIKNN
jgi:hypothetical protein